ncbi:RRP1B protein, partial [Acromyrmex insinuator]
MSRLRHWTHMCGMGLLICNGCDHYERVEESKTKRPNSNNISKTKIKKVMLAREMRIALMLIKKLNNNDEKDKMLRGLSKWLKIRLTHHYFTKTDFLMLWKGFFSFMWIKSNTIYTQKKLAKLFSKSVHCLETRKTIILYISCALQILAVKWSNINHRRRDSFFTLVEMIIRQTFVICKNQSWNMKWVTKFAKMFTQLFLHEKNEDFTMYMAEMYVIESAKICGKNGNLPDDIIRKLFTPFIECMKRKEELHKKAKKEFKTMRNRITLRSVRYNELIHV